MIEKPFDNAKLTKLVKKLLNPPVEVKKLKLVPDLVHFQLFSHYEIPLPAGTLRAIRVVAKPSPELDDKEKRALPLGISYSENGQITTRTIEVSEGFSNTALNIKLPDGVIRFAIDKTKIIGMSITLTYLPTERVEV